MDSASYSRALISGGVLAAVAYTMSQGSHGFADYAMTGALQAAASLGSDTVHDILTMYPTKVTAAVVTGGLFSAAQMYLRGDNNLVMNYGTSAGSEWAARIGQGWLQAQSDVAGSMDIEEDTEAY
jgi:predicted ABC-type sugar transport system permease subunit